MSDPARHDRTTDDVPDEGPLEIPRSRLGWLPVLLALLLAAALAAFIYSLSS